MGKGQSFLIGLICTFIGWKAREKYQKNAQTRPRTEGGQSHTNTPQKSEKTDFYGGIGNAKAATNHIIF